MSTSTIAIPTFGGPSNLKKRRNKPSNSKRDLTGALGEADDVSEDELEAGGEERRDGDGDGEEQDDDDAMLGLGLAMGGKGVGEVEREMMKTNRKRKGEQLLLRNAMDREQGQRFDAFSSAVIPKAAIKKLNREVYDQSISNNLTAVVAGMAKVFVADVVELAKDIQPYTAHPHGPLQPYHLKLAKIKLEEMGMIGGGGSRSAGGNNTHLRPRKAMFKR